MSISIGGQDYVWDVYVVRISDDMLIGLDFLTHCGAVISLEYKSLTICGTQVFTTFTSNSDKSSCKVNRVIMKESMEILPRSVTVAPVLVDGRLQQNFVVQSTLHPDLLAKGIMVPTTLISLNSGISLLSSIFLVTSQYVLSGVVFKESLRKLTMIGNVRNVIQMMLRSGTCLTM